MLKHTLLLAVRFALERIVEVGVAAAGPDEKAGQEVGGDEERAPARALADVDALVGAGLVEDVAGAADNNVAESHGGSAAFEKGAVFEEQADKAAVDFDHALDETETATAEQGQRDKQQTQ